MTLKIDRWPWKTIGHLFYMSSFVHHFKSIGEVKRVTVWKRSSRVKIGKFFVPRDFKIWWMTLKNNRAPLLYHIKLWTAFQSHWYIQTGVAVHSLVQNQICLFCNICTVFKNMFNVGLIIMWSSIVVEGFPTTEIWALENGLPTLVAFTEN